MRVGQYHNVIAKYNQRNVWTCSLMLFTSTRCHDGPVATCERITNGTMLTLALGNLFESAIFCNVDFPNKKPTTLTNL